MLVVVVVMASRERQCSAGMPGERLRRANRARRIGMERRGVVEKSRVLQAGRTDEKITPELSFLWPRGLRGSVETKSSRQEGWYGRPGPGSGRSTSGSRSTWTGLKPRRSSPAGNGMGDGGWEIGMSGS